jgi:hypothetical protein
MFHDMYYGKGPSRDMFTICSFNSPDLDGSRALKTSLRHYRNMFTICSCVQVVSVQFRNVF